MTRPYTKLLREMQEMADWDKENSKRRRKHMKFQTEHASGHSIHCKTEGYRQIFYVFRNEAVPGTGRSGSLYFRSPKTKRGLEYPGACPDDYADSCEIYDIYVSMERIARKRFLPTAYDDIRRASSFHRDKGKRRHREKKHHGHKKGGMTN